MAAPPWLNGLSANRRRQSTCLYIVGGLFASIFLLYSLTYVFFDDIEIDALKSSPSKDDTGIMDYHSHDTTMLSVRQPESSNAVSWDYKAYNDGDLGGRPQQTFHTSDIKSPLFQVNTWKPRATEGAPYIFMTPSVKDQKSGMQIFSRKDLSLVYADKGYRATNGGRMQMHNGKPYLTFWEGQPAPGHGLGTGLLFDDHYQLAYNISTNVFNSSADSHEFQLTHDGGAMFSVYETIRNYDMTPVGGPRDGVLQDSCFEEVDIETGETRFSWRASDWFNITECTVPYNDDQDYGHPVHGDGWDFFHINSLEKTREGNYLVVGRRLNVVTLIDGKSGRPIWQVGGKNNQYEDLSDGMATNFRYQHHARFDNEEQTEIVMFDNSQLAPTQPTPGCEEQCSRGLHIRLNHNDKTAELVRSYWHPKSVQARAEGGAHRQENGNLLVGWGKVPGFTEFTNDGEVLLDVQTGPFSSTTEGYAHVYRIFSMDWKAYPPWDPAIAMHDGNVYVSWNGATELRYWALFTGENKDTLDVQYVVHRGGFETKLSLPSLAKYARAAALDGDGILLGSTNVVNTQTGQSTTMSDTLSINFTLEPHSRH